MKRSNVIMDVIRNIIEVIRDKLITIVRCWFKVMRCAVTKPEYLIDVIIMLYWTANQN